MTQAQQPWWKTDKYEGDFAIPADFLTVSGIEGPALVRVWGDGKTDPGWGLTDKDNNPAFIPLYTRKKFQARTILAGYAQDKWAFAFVMRSMRVVCIDIDGKNGGFDNVGKLGMLPHTLAETSKSGNGYHLFYLVSEDEWDPDAGFALFTDRIGIEQGVDIRATGCVYHHHQQRWNGRKLVELPQHIKDRLHAKAQTAAAQTAAIVSVLDNGDPMEVAMMQDNLITDLNKPIQPGKRNTTLFAIGTQMFEAQVPRWQDLLVQRALLIGLDAVEATKLVSNIQKYGVSKP